MVPNKRHASVSTHADHEVIIDSMPGNWMGTGSRCLSDDCGAL